AIKTSSGKGNALEAAAKETFLNLSPQELALLRSGRQLWLGSSGSPVKTDGPLDPDLVLKVQRGMGGIKLMDGHYMGYWDLSDPEVIPYEKLEGAGAGVSLLLKITDLGGANISGEAHVHGKEPTGRPHAIGAPVSVGSVLGPAESPLDNAKENVKL